MGEIVEVKIPNGDIVQLKKDYLGYRVIEKPTKWYHYIVGSKKNFIILIFLMILALFFYIGVTEMLSTCKDAAENPCLYCLNKTTTFNLSNFSIG